MNIKGRVDILSKHTEKHREELLSTAKSRRYLEQCLKKGAEIVVGKTCCPTKTNEAVTGEPYVKYYVRFQDADLDDFVNRRWIEEHFLQWIEAYRVFVESVVGEGEIVKSGLRKRGDFVLYWRLNPEVNEHDGYIYVKARLLISETSETAECSSFLL